MPEKKFLSQATFFQLNTHNEAAILSLVEKISQKFQIDGVIPGDDHYGLLTAKIGDYLQKPGLKPEIAFKVYHQDFLRHISKESGFYIPNYCNSESYIDGQDYNITLPVTFG